MDAFDPTTAPSHAESASAQPPTGQAPAGRPVPDGPLDRETAMAVLARADALLADGDYPQAAAYYQRVVGFDDAGVTGAALLGLGEALYRLDQDAAAVQAWESVLQLGETAASYQAWRRVAESRVRAGDIRGAMEAYRQAERRAPQADRAYIAGRLGWLSKELGDGGASRRYFARSRGDVALVSAATLTLGITIAVSLIAMFSPGTTLQDMLALDKVAVARGEWWRLLSVTLLHAGVLHLFFNMYALYLAGPIVEHMYGARWFVVLYVLCALGGSVASFAFGSGRLAVGASGAIFGLFGLLVSSDRTHRPILDLRSRNVVAQLGTLIVLNIIIGFTPGIDWVAHLGGLVTGAWLGFVIRPGNVQTLAGLWQQTGTVETRVQRVGVPAVGILLLIALLFAGLIMGGPKWGGTRVPGIPPSNAGTVSVLVAHTSSVAAQRDS